MSEVPYYRFWHSQSGFLGGVLLGGAFLLYILCMAALVKYLLF